MQRLGSVLTKKRYYPKRCCALCNTKALERLRHYTEMRDTELIALLERAALNAAVIVARYLLVAGTHRLAGSIGSHADVLTTADELTGCAGLLRDSATALQAAVVQPHRALDYTLRWLQDSNLLPPAQPETTQ